MASYIVLVPPSQDNQVQGDRTVFIRDGFAIIAFVLPVPWLLFNRLWFEAALVFAAVTAISIVGSYTGHGNLAEIVAALLALLVAFEASNWRIKAFERRGFYPAAIIDARSAADAETAYFHGDQFAVAPAPALPDIPRVAPAVMTTEGKPVAGGMLGLVGYRGER
ncbi:DUF2628 domain-containing protein [Phyllobacterium myrsinacearum]|uniref:DUF2628 domain-containing protein n=1 Tax=Phyllobacterium myrsinacearum TaxID=28101 RepID=A0A839EHJ8_9HYPH|nr:DUF2628 domain-containing protein [Phyllobacterium myrsinacearum]MBA8877838.1 hypothetical protein [Phyllobacterium myrsinacearum]